MISSKMAQKLNRKKISQQLTTINRHRQTNVYVVYNANDDDNDPVDDEDEEDDDDMGREVKIVTTSGKKSKEMFL